MMAEFALSDVQAEAILNMRLRNLRKLEEMEIRAERDALIAERAGLAALLGRRGRRSGRGSPSSCARCARPSARTRPGGARRTGFDDAPEVEEVTFEAMIEREPVTVVCSEMGWIRAMKGHLAARRRAQVQGRRRAALLPARGDDRPAAAVRLERADVHAGLRRAAGRARHGRAGAADGRPAERGADAGALRPRARRQAAGRLGGGRRLHPARGRGGGADPRRAAGAEPEARACARGVCRPITGDHVAVVGENRKLLVFPRSELPEMGRGKGVRLQRYKEPTGGWTTR